MKYDITFSCGHKGIVALIGKGKDREKALWYYENQGLCEACYEEKQRILREQREAEKQRMNEESAMMAELMNLPVLTGSEKQVIWATTIRQTFLDFIKSEIEKSRTATEKDKEKLQNVVQYMCDSIKSASTWIDNRELSGFYKLVREYTVLYEANPVPLDDYKEEELKDIIISCEEPKHSGEVKITVDTDKKEISASYVRNNDFSNTVKDLKYTWNGKNWSRKVTPRNGDINDRAAELANKLLLKGFTVNVPTELIKEKAVSADYEPEHERWITLYTGGEHKGWLCFEWGKSDSKMYDKIKSLRKSKYTNGKIAVPVDVYKEILDFSEIYNFKFSAIAWKAITEYAESVETVAVSKKETALETDKLQEILNSESEVINDLKD